MPNKAAAPLKTALTELRAQRATIEKQINAVEGAIAALGGEVTRSGSAAQAAAPVKKRRKRKPLTAAQRKAISARMKASWAKRKRAAR